ncbi:MAG: PD40 domain-containing protein, partial [Thermoplasmata archaeon]|nr:PD40 domain-containing protein [Thermoplasmata archaeon]
MSPTKSRSRTHKRRALRFEDLMSVDRVAGPKVSPDGRLVAYTTTKADMENNKMSSTVRVHDLRTGVGRELTPGHGSHSAPAWSHDGSQLAFVSDRGEDGSQIWVL